MNIRIIDALQALVPKAQFVLKNDVELDWHDERPQPTEEEIQAKIAELEAAEPMRLLRIARNRILQESDWITIKAYSQGVEVSAEWKTYLQALRDLPENSEPSLDEQGNLTNVIWPTPPE